MTITWFGHSLWISPKSAFIFYFANYGLGIYFVWHGLGRRFQNRAIAFLSKGHSYWLSGLISFMLLGFSIPHVSDSYRQNSYKLSENFQVMLLFQTIYFIILIFAMSPHRKSLQNWLRYRHQKTKKNLLWDLTWGEESPTPLAIALNLIPAYALTLTGILLLPLEGYSGPILAILLLTNSIVLIYASLVQWLLLQKTKHRAIAAMIAIMSLVFFPFLAMVVGQWESSRIFMSFNPSSILGLLMSQTLAIALINWQMYRQLRSLGQSELKTLLQNNPPSRKLSGVS